MAFPRNSLRAFLQYARTNLNEALKGNRKVNIVIGNESADLDSLSSSLLYAYFRSSAPPSGAFSPIYIPLLNIHQSGIRLRPEFSAACQHAGIPTSSLLNLDDIEAGFNRPDQTRWILVDHNKLQGSLGNRFSRYIHGVIDHHDEENTVPSVTAPEPRIIEKAGSCTSLVIRHFQPTWDAISDQSISSGAGHGQGEFAINDSAFTQRWDAQLAKLGLASILTDTANLTTAPRGKAREVDRQAVKYAEAKIHISTSDAKAWNRDAFHAEITAAKSNIDHLSLEEILIKDYKEWHAATDDDNDENGLNLGISSVVKSLAFLVQKQKTTTTNDPSQPSIETILNNFMTKHNLTLYAIMTAFTTEHDGFQRELLLQARAPVSDHFFTNLSTTLTTELQLSELPTTDVPGIERRTESPSPSPSSSGGGGTADIWRRNIWTQRDVSKSRKEVAPLLRREMVRMKR